jgi:hypothetical protein
LLFELCPEHPQGEHIEKDVHEPAMQEHVGNRLPKEKILDEQLRYQAAVNDHILIQFRQEPSKEKDHDIGNEKYANTRGQSAPHVKTILIHYFVLSFIFAQFIVSPLYP